MFREKLVFSQGTRQVPVTTRLPSLPPALPPPASPPPPPQPQPEYTGLIMLIVSLLLVLLLGLTAFAFYRQKERWKHSLYKSQLERGEEKGTFFFLCAEELRSGRFQRLPVFKDALVQENLVKIKSVNLREACFAKYKSNILAVSHRWDNPGDPDSSGVQCQKICEFLSSPEGQSFDWVWYDWSCLPQGKEKTPLEKRVCNRMLGEMNLLYLGCFVLVLLDASYLGRFWTQVWMGFEPQPTQPATEPCFAFGTHSLRRGCPFRLSPARASRAGKLAARTAVTRAITSSLCITQTTIL